MSNWRPIDYVMNASRPHGQLPPRTPSLEKQLKRAIAMAKRYRLENAKQTALLAQRDATIARLERELADAKERLAVPQGKRLRSLLQIISVLLIEFLRCDLKKGELPNVRVHELTLKHRISLASNTVAAVLAAARDAWRHGDWQREWATKHRDEAHE